ncbi:hypothetical protein BY996DRAFT_8533512 [Phakopsora pachyrhizi]|uniref:Mediator of RNA polymerase II transcription subunit 4 n=1 Tax=Phakopsora pachyrhizi TaxID=170000 RepID=A0AAV0AF51_PHAPC|nr:hypothetical protein BY996DRAFT_8533512 [Phakopsora pachyrhizi]CAH7665991.1 expressed protein [Phakopsora pachyrhizi]
MTLSQQSTVNNLNSQPPSSTVTATVTATATETATATGPSSINLSRSNNSSITIEADKDPSSLSSFEIRSPNRDEPLNRQFQRYLNRFRTLTATIFDQISDQNHLTQSHSSANLPHHPHHIQSQEELIERFEINKNYLIQLLRHQIEHDQNLEKIDLILGQIEEIRNRSIKSKIRSLDSISRRLNKIVKDGEEDQKNFERIDSLNLTPSLILGYARLISPYTSAPPAPVQSNQNEDRSVQQSFGLDLKDPSLRFLMPFPTEDVIRRGWMGKEMSSLSDLNNFDQINYALGEIKDADGARPSNKPESSNAFPTPASRRPNNLLQIHQAQSNQLDQNDDDLFDLDLNPDL